MSLMFVVGAFAVVFWIARRMIREETNEHRRLD